MNELKIQLQNNTMDMVLSKLQSRGFSYLFKIKDECISCKDYNIGFEELDILEVHRFEAKLIDACDNFLYAVECNKYNIKGVIISSCNIYANAFSSVVIEKIVNNQNFRYKNYSFQ